MPSKLANAKNPKKEVAAQGGRARAAEKIETANATKQQLAAAHAPATSLAFRAMVQKTNFGESK